MSERVKKKRKRGMSLRAKIVTAFVVMALVIAATSVGVSYINYQNAMNRNYETMADNVASTAESQLNAQDNVSFYLSLDTLEETYAQLTPTDHSASEYIESQSSYISIVAALSEIVDANDNVVRSLYLIVPSTDGEGFYYLFDTAPEGSGRYYAEYETFAGSTFADFAAEMRAGEEIEPVIGEALGSWLMNICHHAELADTSYYLCVSLSMDVVQQDQISFFVTMVAVVLLIVVLFVIIYLILFNAILVTPIKRMTKAAADFIDEGSTSEESSIAVLDIHTGDELQNLSESLKKMEGDINNYINNLYYYTAEQERLGTELSIARQIQADMLPSIFPAFPEHEEFDIYASMNPAKEVGGDFYDFFMVDERHLAIVVADVSGKGVPAALFMVIAKTLIKDHTQQMKTELGEVFTKVNTLLCDSNNEGMFVTAFEGVLDLETGLLTYVNAGHELPFVMGFGGHGRAALPRGDHAAGGGRQALPIHGRRDGSDQRREGAVRHGPPRGGAQRQRRQAGTRHPARGQARHRRLRRRSRTVRRHHHAGAGIQAPPAQERGNGREIDHSGRNYRKSRCRDRLHQR